MKIQGKSNLCSACIHGLDFFQCLALPRPHCRNYLAWVSVKLWLCWRKAENSRHGEQRKNSGITFAKIYFSLELSRRPFPPGDRVTFNGRDCLCQMCAQPMSSSPRELSASSSKLPSHFWSLSLFQAHQHLSETNIMRSFGVFYFYSHFKKWTISGNSCVSFFLFIKCLLLQMGRDRHFNVEKTTFPQWLDFLILLW